MEQRLILDLEVREYQSENQLTQIPENAHRVRVQCVYTSACEDKSSAPHQTHTSSLAALRCAAAARSASTAARSIASSSRSARISRSRSSLSFAARAHHSAADAAALSRSRACAAASAAQREREKSEQQANAIEGETTRGVTSNGTGFIALKYFREQLERDYGI